MLWSAFLILFYSFLAKGTEIKILHNHKDMIRVSPELMYLESPAEGADSL
jgi:hypothetical protein